jgi:hypothetical protein
MSKYRYNDVLDILADVFRRSQMGRIFPISKTGKHKIVISLSKILVKHIDEMSKENSNQMTLLRALLISLLPLIIFYSAVVSIIRYSFINRLIRKKGNRKLFFDYRKLQNKRVIIFNSARETKRYDRSLFSSLKHEYALIQILNNRIILDLWKSKYHNEDSLLHTTVHIIRLIHDTLQAIPYILRMMILLVGSLRNIKCKTLLSIYYEISQFILAQIVHNRTMRKITDRIVKYNKKSIFIFDMDASGREMFLAEYLTEKGCCTIHLQHGILVQPEYYLSSCKYHLCSSHREELLLNGQEFNSSIVSPVGLPYQNLKHIEKKIELGAYQNSALIILPYCSDQTKKNLNIHLSESKVLSEYNSIYLRHHPMTTLSDKKKFLSGSNIFEFQGDLFESINCCNPIITYSFDVLITLVFSGIKAIVGLPDYWTNVNESFREFENEIRCIPGIYVFSNSGELDKILRDYEKNIDTPIPNQDRLIEKVFGSVHTREILIKRIDEIMKENPQNNEAFSSISKGYFK